jgi:hypothetical protein
MECGVEGAFFNAEEVVGGALDVEDYAVSVELADLGESFEDEEIQCSLKVVFSHSSIPLDALG